MALKATRWAAARVQGMAADIGGRRWSSRHEVQLQEIRCPRELLVLPRPDVAPASNSWSGLLDLQLEELQVLDLTAYPDEAPPADDGDANEQTRKRFADEAATIVGATARIVWAAPSRDEAVAGLPTEVDATDLVFGEEIAAPEAGPVQGGRERGLVIHKLFEEVLTGEIEAAEATLAARAVELIRQLGLEPSADAAIGLSPGEVARVVARTLALPEIAAVRDRLLPELPVLASDQDDGVEVATAGIVDALCLGDGGRPDLVIDWKSDVDPDPTVAEQYQRQVRRYLEVTGTTKGLVVFVTNGTIMKVVP
jgi:exodeoxyribonuclease-5